MPIFDAVRSGGVATVRMLLDHDPNLISATDDNGDGPLHVAAWSRQTEVARLLLDLGGDPNAMNRPETGSDWECRAVAARRRPFGAVRSAVRAVTGWNVSLWELMKVGERRLNLLRAFNAREGVGAEADTVPPKLLIPLEGGASDGVAIMAEEIEAGKALYYRMAGWDENGRPARAKLEELALGWVADELGL